MGQKGATEFSDAPCAPPRLRLAHIVLWTFFTAAMFALGRLDDQYNWVLEEGAALLALLIVWLTTV